MFCKEVRNLNNKREDGKTGARRKNKEADSVKKKKKQNSGKECDFFSPKDHSLYDVAMTSMAQVPVPLGQWKLCVRRGKKKRGMQGLKG